VINLWVHINGFSNITVYMESQLYLDSIWITTEDLKKQIDCIWLRAANANIYIYTLCEIMPFVSYRKTWLLITSVYFWWWWNDLQVMTMRTSVQFIGHRHRVRGVEGTFFGLLRSKAIGQQIAFSTYMCEAKQVTSADFTHLIFPSGSQYRYKHNNVLFVAVE